MATTNLIITLLIGITTIIKLVLEVTKLILESKNKKNEYRKIHFVKRVNI